MKKFCILLFLLINLDHLNGQIVPTVDEYVLPVSASVCNVNGGFIMRNINPPAIPAGGWPSTFKLYLQIFVVNSVTYPYDPVNIPYPWATFPNCYSNNPAGNPVRPSITNFSAPGFNLSSPNPSWDLIGNTFEWEISVNAQNSSPMELIEYDVYLDCSIKSLSAGNPSGNLYLIQKWYYTGGNITTPELLTTQPPQPISVFSPNIVPIIPSSQFITVDAPFNPNGPNSHWYFTFQNNGNAVANIIVSEFYTDPCPGYQKIAINPINYIITNSVNPPAPPPGNGWIPLPGSNVPINQIPIGEYLHIVQTVIVNGCMKDCSPPVAASIPKVHFAWKCANGIVPDNCPECQRDYDFQLKYNKGIESYKISRTLPVDDHEALHNTECQGETTPWQFEVTNTGTATLYDVDITFGNPYPSSLSMVDAVTVTDFPSCPLPPCTTLVTTPLSPAFSFDVCSTIPSNPLKSFIVTIANLPPGESVFINFSTHNIATNDNDPVPSGFLNGPKYFNQWRVLGSATTICNPASIINPNYDNSITNGNRGISGYATNNVNDLNMMPIDFFPTPSHITVPDQSPPVPYFETAPTFYYMEFDGLFGDVNDQQALGFSAANTTPISGYIKAVITCSQGLTISNPNNVMFAVPDGANGHILLRNIHYSGFCTPVSTQTAPLQITVGGVSGIDVFDANNCSCGEEEYELIFRISDLTTLGLLPADLPNLFTQGKFIFGLTACCPQITPSNYNVEFSLLPNESCFNLTNGNCSPVVGGAICCWLPLSSKGGQISVHCPGCKAPGTIIDDYKIARTTYGFPDVTNDGLVDNPTPSPILYQPGRLANNNTYSRYTDLYWMKSAYGDELEDYVIAHFQDGDNTNGGYTYSDMYTSSAGVDLDVIQLHRDFKNSGVLDYDVQVTGFDFYIDASIQGSSCPTLLPPCCIDCEIFGPKSKDTPTLLHMYVPLSGLNVGQLFDRRPLPYDNEMLFTFTELELQSKHPIKYILI